MSFNSIYLEYRENLKGDTTMICENCVEDKDYDHSGCRANEETCIDGKNCPDYVENCDCTVCWPMDKEEVKNA